MYLTYTGWGWVDAWLSRTRMGTWGFFWKWWKCYRIGWFWLLNNLTFIPSNSFKDLWNIPQQFLMLRTPIFPSNWPPLGIIRDSLVPGSAICPLWPALTLSSFMFHQISSLKNRLKKVSTTTGDGVARAFLKAQAAFFGSYRNALKIEPVSSLLAHNSICIWSGTKKPPPDRTNPWFTLRKCACVCARMHACMRVMEGLGWRSFTLNPSLLPWREDMKLPQCLCVKCYATPFMVVQLSWRLTGQLWDSDSQVHISDEDTKASAKRNDWPTASMLIILPYSSLLLVFLRTLHPTNSHFGGSLYVVMI